MDKKQKTKSNQQKTDSSVSVYCLLFSEDGGYAALTTTLLTVMVSLTIIGGFTFFAFQEVNVNRAFVKSIESRYVSEAGVEDAVYRLATGKQLASSETLIVGNGATTIIHTIQGNQHTIRSEGKRDQYQQNLEARIDTGSAPPPPSVSFNYGAQIGAGGVEMSQNSQIQGSVYSNGSITGPSSGSNATITGDALAAGVSQIINLIINGNAQANAIDGSVISGDATSTVSISGTVTERGHAGSIDNSVLNKDSFSDSLISSVVNGKCYYQTQSIDSVCVLGEFPGTPFTSSPNLPALALPISDAQINQWKTDAVAGGTISGNYSVTSNVSLGPKKITGDLEMESNNKTLTVTGTIHVQGNVEIENGSTIKCAASYGTNSCVVLADGTIHLANNGQFSGSGTAGSFLMLLSTASGGGHHGSAIDLHNNASGVIFYAGSGMIYLHNNVMVTNLTANKIHLENGAKIIYDTLLQNVNFPPSGGGGGGNNDIKYWKEAE